MTDGLDLQNTLHDLPSIESFQPDGLVSELVSQMDEYVAEINSLRDRLGGLNPTLVKKIENQFLADRVRHSATIEGSTLDRRETLHVLLTGQIIEGKVRPSEEVKNLGHAIRHASDLVRVDFVRETDIRDIHKLILEGIDPNAGRYRPHDVRITNATYRPPEHLDVPRLMNQLIENLRSAENNNIHGFIIATYCHWCIARIHPFVDGNGRISRVLQDLYFLRRRLVPTPIPFQRVDDYYEGLQEADGGNPRPFLEFVATATLDSLQKYRAAIDEYQETEDWLEELIASTNASVRDHEQAGYNRYLQRIGEFRETIRKILDSLTDRVPEVQFRFRQYGGIDLTQFRQLKNEGRAPKTWDFGFELTFRDRKVRFVFWHGTYWSLPTDSHHFKSREPALLASIEENGTYHTLTDAGEEGVSLRAILVQGNSFLRIRFNPISDQNEFDFEQSAAAICRDFIKEVLRSKLGLG